MTFTNRGERDTKTEREKHTQSWTKANESKDDGHEEETNDNLPPSALIHASIGLLAGQVHLP